MTSNVWTFIIHQDYIQSLRYVVSDQDRYALGMAIRDVLEEADDPTRNATPVPYRSGRFYIELMGYRVFFEVDVDAEGQILEETTSIILLPVEVAESE